MDERISRLIAAPIAHRGLHACGGRGPIENSLSAAQAAIEAGYGIECDVQLSHDGEAMVIHDDRLARLTGASGWVGEQTAATLSGLRLGDTVDRVPRLVDLLELIAGRVPLVIEIKSPGDGDLRLIDRTLALLAAYAGPVAVESFDPGIVRYARAQAAPCPVGLVGPPESGAPPDAEAVTISDFLSWSIDALVTAPVRPGQPLTSWTVRSLEQSLHAAHFGAQIVFEGFRP